MKSIGHAWVALMALERLKPPKRKGYMKEHFGSYHLGKSFNSYYNQQAERFVGFFDKHKDAFVQGAWFPDSVISDNLTGGHTYKLKTPSKKSEIEGAKTITNQTPSHLSSINLVSSGLERKVYVKHADYILPDRCEALGHAIRDMMAIHRKEIKGSTIMHNIDQMTLYFLMLSHYLADAHVPPHSDARDFYGPSTIHPDMEKFWDKEIKKFYEFDKKRKVFDYDIDGAPELKSDKRKLFEDSFLYKVLETLNSRKWNPADKKAEYLGKDNKKTYDYAKAVCLVSYNVSKGFIPEMPKKEYDKLKILEDENYRQKLEELSVHVIADAIDSIALIWLLTWDKYNRLKEGIKDKKKQIKKEKKGKL
ncbi:hypothetical protein KY317_04070 [Candidatus Woesearchaeota archaeon]|nr:hypothetical protein [Candidatus Woesearchaeota archaeon]